MPYVVRSTITLYGAWLGFLLTSCFGCTPPIVPAVPPIPPPASQPQAPASAAAASQPATKGGVIAGIVRFGGPAVAPIRVNTSVDPLCTVPVFTEDITINPNGTLGNVFVYVKQGLPQPAAMARPATPLIIDARGWRFVPHVLGVQAGRPIQYRNCDPGVHKFHLIPRRNTESNVSLPKPASTLMLAPLVRVEIGIALVDAVHPWMSAYVCVVDHPFFNVTGTAGVFRLDGLPAGTYLIETWHEKLGVKQQSVTVKDGQVEWITIKY